MPTEKRSRGVWLALTLVVLFLAGVLELLFSPLRSGNLYPPYSSLRSDPLGARALLDSLNGLPAFKVSRSYGEETVPDRDTVLFELGVDAASWTTRSTDALTDFERLLANHGRVVVAFLPTYGPESTSNSDAPSSEAMTKRWDINVHYVSVPKADRDDSIPRDSALYFSIGKEWTILEGSEDGPTTVQRDLAGGTLVLVADSFPLSNQGLVERRDVGAIRQLVGAAHRVIFDEHQLGVSETGSVATLIRKYRMEGALFVLAIVAALWIWRSASTFLPPRKRARDGSVAGRDANEGMVALLHRNIAEKDLLQACWTQWKRSAPQDARTERVRSEIEGFESEILNRYRAACRILTE
jgi:hypothetical protein